MLAVIIWDLLEDEPLSAGLLGGRDVCSFLRYFEFREICFWYQ